jgi:Flp pilus assembly protein TadB
MRPVTPDVNRLESGRRQVMQENPIFKLAHRRKCRLGFWWQVVWWCYVSGKIIAFAAGIIVPFGLAALLYVPANYARSLNIALLVLSFIAILAQVVVDALRVRDRSLSLRRLHQTLETEIAKAQAGETDIKALIAVMERTSSGFTESNLP